MGSDERFTPMLTISIPIFLILGLQDILMKIEKYLTMLNDGEKYFEIVTLGVSHPSKPMCYFQTGIKV